MNATTNEAGLVELPAVLDLTAAAPLTERLLALRGAPLAIDASKVEKLGGQCLQILLSAAATWKADGAPLTIVEASDSFDAGLQLLGLTQDALTAMELQA